MFGNLKKKLNSAIQEGIVISESLQQQYLQRVNSPFTPTMGESASSSVRGSMSNLSTAELGIPNEVNMTAGCNLLAKYEDGWKAIQEANEENGLKAAQVAEKIEAIHKRTNDQRIVMTDLITCLAGIPALVAKLEASMEALQQVRTLSDEAEKKLEQLEDICEECELQDFMLQKQYELSQHKQKKMNELEVYRQKLAAEHQEKIRQHEDRWRQMQRERQAVFDDAFRGDLEEFKKKGSIPKLVVHKGKDANGELALEEVVLDDSETKDALEEFLNG